MKPFASSVLIPALLLSLAPMTHAAETKFASLVLGGGCFWCTEATYQLVPGVKAVTSGYSGGKEPNPTYADITSHRTGHAEVIKIDYDPAAVTLAALLDYFWQVHNPTQVGGQGNDHGPQYRSIILYADETQKAAALQSRVEAGKVFRDPITTEIVPLVKFWPAESYHQDYFAKNPSAGYCQFVIAPKVRKLQEKAPVLQGKK